MSIPEDLRNKHKVRLDQLMVRKKLVSSREQAQRLIMAGMVTVQGQVIDKPGSQVFPAAEIGISEKESLYVSRGGEKLEGALDDLGIDVQDKIILDVGASTGGFTDCLLQRGAQKVFAVDVGYGQLAWKLRQDSRVVPLEKKNVRFIKSEDIGQKVDLITIDVSFISLKLVLPAVKPLLESKGQILALVKPQFEVGKGQVGKGGIVKDAEKHKKVISEISLFSEKLGLTVVGVTESRLMGPKGNREFFIHLIWEP